MKFINWNKEKNEWLRKNRKITFEEIIDHLENGDSLLDDLLHPNQEKYPKQRIMIFGINDYVYLVPYVESEKEIFLKTIFPSRSLTKKYLRKKTND